MDYCTCISLKCLTDFKNAADGWNKLRYCAIPVVQRVVERVLSFQTLFAGKSKWKIRVGIELRDMHHLYMGLCRFLYKENFYYFPEGALEMCPYLHVPRVKHEPKYTLIELVEAAKAMENWVGIEPCSRLLK